MADLKDTRLIVLKGYLFLLAGLGSSALLVAEHPSAKVVLLLAVAVWSFARFYYFAFYVIGQYVDPGYRFAGLWSFARYQWSRRGRRRQEPVHGRPSPDRPGGATGGREVTSDD